MKIGILTHYEVLNQGAQLQMYAMYNYLEKMGHDPVVLTFEKDFSFDNDEKLKNHITLKSVPYVLSNYLIKKGIKLTVHNVKKFIVSKYFQKSQFRFAPYDTRNLDAVIVGSDEVYSIPVGINKVMFGYGITAKKIIGYAPSFGQTTLENIKERKCFDLMSDGFKKYTYLSARDKHTQALVTQICQITPQIVCDPVILYNFPITEFKKPKYKYIVVYSYDRHMNDDNEIAAIKKVAKENNWKIVSPGTFHRWCDVNVVCDALEWIEWFRNAEFVITDTFHGTVVSSIVNAPMAVYIRQSINTNKLKGLVETLKIENRIISEVSYDAIAKLLYTDFDKKQLITTVEQLRIVGKSYLEGALNEEEA